MTGMKSGAGEDPFADARESDTASSEDENERRTDTEPAGSDPFDGADAGTTVDRSTATSEAKSRPGNTVSVDDLPYIARRNVRGESVKFGRDKNILFEIRPAIADCEDEFIDDLENRLGTDVSKTDAREAALSAIWDRPELVAPILEEWGLGYFED